MEGLNEIFRVLKSNGEIYFDASIHLHGHEMFIAGDIERIHGLFDPARWQEITIEKWRQDYSPLERYPTPESDAKSWEHSVITYSRELFQDILKTKSVMLVTIKAKNDKFIIV